MLHIYRLPDALPGEEVKTIVHRDAFIAVRRIAFFVLLLVLPIILLMMINYLFPELANRVWVWPVLLLLASSYLLFIWLLFFFSLIDYFLDVWIITSERVIDVKQNGFFSRSISEARLDKIQDISSQVSGFFPTVLKYGNVIVQTASETNSLYFEEVSKPEHIRDILVRLVDGKHKTSKSTTT